MRRTRSRKAVTKIQAAIVAVVIIIAAAVGIYYYTLPPPVIEPSIAVYAYTTTDVVVFWDPSETYSNEVIVFNNVYETLIRYDPFKDEYLSVLATSWTVSDDGLTYTFNLRKDVKFHCGHSMEASDVKYSIERNMKGYDGEGPRGASWIWYPVEEVNVVDDDTVQFVLSFPSALLNVASAAYCAHIYCEECTEEHGYDWFYEGNELGTGPYMLEEYDKAMDMVTLTKFEDYWGGWEGKHFDKVVIKSVPSWATARLQLEAGEADFVDRLPFEDIEALMKTEGIEIVRTAAYQNMFGFFNMEKPPLDDKLVRQAISYAVPYDDIVTHVMSGYARQSKGPVPYGLWGHSEEVSQYSYNLDKAKELLIQAGYSDPTACGFSLLYTYNAGDEYERRTGELMKAELDKLGITLEIRGMPWEEQWGLATAEDPEARQDIFVMYWWPDYPDPNTFLGPMFHSEEEIVFNFGYYDNPEYDTLIDDGAAIAGTDREEAIRMFRDAQQILVEDAPSIFFFDQEYTRAKRASMKGYVDNPAYAHVVWWYDCYREE